MTMIKHPQAIDARRTAQSMFTRAAASLARWGRGHAPVEPKIEPQVRQPIGPEGADAMRTAAARADAAPPRNPVVEPGELGLKYVRHSSIGFVLWPRTDELWHSAVREALPRLGTIVSAGFATVAGGEVRCWGDSKSLCIRSREDDSEALARQLGLRAARAAAPSAPASATTRVAPSAGC